MTIPIIVLIGPTAVGKNSFAYEIASFLKNICILNTDSIQCYRYCDIGSAKPNLATLNQLPHHLIDIINPDQSFSALKFREHLLDCLPALFSKQQIPILVGGSMLYTHMLLNKIHLLPETPVPLRDQISKEIEQFGLPHLYQELKTQDPSTQIDPKNTQRIQRAIEILRLTGKSISWWWQQPPLDTLQDIFPEHPIITIQLVPSTRQILHSPIKKRLLHMIKSGFIEEINYLLDTYPNQLNDSIRKAVGYRQFIDYRLGFSSKNEALSNAQKATEQLVKRQMTWLKKMPSTMIVEAPYTQNDIQKVLQMIHH